MAKKQQLPPPLPEREELRHLPQAPRMIMEISRLLRFRVREREEGGLMAQNTARLVLSHLAAHENVNQLELVKMTRLKAPTVSVLLRRLEGEGYVTRVTDPVDRRAVRVSLSEKGREFDRLHLSNISNNDQTAMAGLTPEEQATLESLLVRVRDNLLEGN
ncbi:MAG: MarR family transcriptional regulator [Clostridia bacterium]|nr:MarR family transcriptional regulator [Clostridia bacterium]